MALPLLRAFTQADTSRIWDLLNEIRASLNGALGLLNKQAFGAVNQPVDSSARITVSHGLGVAPASVVTQLRPIGTADVDTISKLFVDSVTSTTITFRLWRTDTKTWFTGNPVSFYWWAAA